MCIPLTEHKALGLDPSRKSIGTNKASATSIRAGSSQDVTSTER